MITVHIIIIPKALVLFIYFLLFFKSVNIKLRLSQDAVHQPHNVNKSILYISDIIKQSTHKNSEIYCKCLVTKI